MFLLIAILLFSSFMFLKRRTPIPINWPVVGMLPDVFLHMHHIHDFATNMLKLSDGTFLLKGPWFANIDMLLTSNPSNIHYILSKNFPNYPKGPDFRNIFDIFGDAVFNSDHELWEFHRRTTNMCLFRHPDFNTILETNILNKTEKGLLPFLDSVSLHQMETDLQDIFQRFTFDVMCLLVLDYDPESLSIGLPIVPCEKAFTDAEEALLWRHFLPQKVWKMQKRFGLGKEKKLSEASKAFDEFMYMCLSRKEDDDHEETYMLAFGYYSYNCGTWDDDHEETGLLTSMMRGFEGQSGTSGDPKKFLKDTLLGIMVAGRDTTSITLSWFFYLLTQNPSVEKKIRKEIENKMNGRKWKSLGVKELGGLVYLHGGICEALRLYPPIGFEHKAPSNADILPSGHIVAKDTRIILSFYSMGRMEGIWGDDCLEFKPERWFSQGGGIKHEPSYKFPAFNSGPRTCLGKEMSLIQIKMVAIAIIYHYHVELVEGHKVCPSDSIILQMKYGLKVRIFPKLSTMAEHEP